MRPRVPAAAIPTDLAPLPTPQSTGLTRELLTPPAAAPIQPRSDYLLVLSASLIALGLALFIVFHAFRGYRRNDSVRMLYLATGLCLITVVPTALSLAVDTVGQLVALDPRVYTVYQPLANRASEVLGLCALLYSLLVTPAESG
ncbi:hypothetical protein C479_09428 [Halovivax asiaticus JCM 14624]|uniref:Uncharacterized protein n=1 Tax=Halovivax asiaticus JCM 14624 TaxID=1227490 RepID=M0BJH1_9EURY|nr:hypothetical protein [Halovivax asiaticus]ELZ11021.1 hypothetical protein C479_09428 [Halovivax asiaticus JCM 14624]